MTASTNPRRAAASALVVLPAILLGCPRGGEGNAGAPDRPAGAAGSAAALRVGNPSRGADEQPDYDSLAAQVRGRVAGRLPEPLPPVREACTAMLNAAAAMYPRMDSVGGDALVQRLAATHDADLVACEAQTSASAAVCVTLLVDEDAGEWPWLLDQCSRAFPR